MVPCRGGVADTFQNTAPVKDSTISHPIMAEPRRPQPEQMPWSDHSQWSTAHNSAVRGHHQDKTNGLQYHRKHTNASRMPISKSVAI